MNVNLSQVGVLAAKNELTQCLQYFIRVVAAQMPAIAGNDAALRSEPAFVKMWSNLLSVSAGAKGERCLDDGFLKSERGRLNLEAAKKTAVILRKELVGMSANFPEKDQSPPKGQHHH